MSDATKSELVARIKDVCRATGYVTNGQAWEIAEAVAAALAAVPQPSDERERGYAEGLDAAYAAMFDIKGDKATRFDAQTAIRKLKEARAQATPGALTSEAEAATTDEQIEQAYKDLQARKATERQALFDSRIGRPCKLCNTGKYAVDGNGYTNFHRCDVCSHVPFWDANDTDLAARTALGPKP